MKTVNAAVPSTKAASIPLRIWLARARRWFCARNISGSATVTLDFTRLEYSGPVIRL